MRELDIVANRMKNDQTEGLTLLRLLMVLSSLSPLFVLWAIRGTVLIPDLYFVMGCTVLALLPTFVLWLRIRIAWKQHDIKPLVVHDVEDHQVHILIYLFAILLPFYRQSIESWREFAAICVALGFIIFLFWYLRLHYMNIIFAVARYRIYMLHPATGENPYSGRNSYTLITRRRTLFPGQHIICLRITDTLYLERQS